MTDVKSLPLPDMPAGSQGSGEPVFLVVGKFRRSHGVVGEMLMEPITDFPERLQAGVTVYVGQKHQSHQIQSCRQSGSFLLIRLVGYDTPEEAGELRNQLVYVRADDRPPLPEGEYYHHQIIGLRVITEEGRFLGVIREILNNPANDVYIVQPETGREILLPALKSVILSVDLAKGEMLIHLLPGIIEGE